MLEASNEERGLTATRVDPLYADALAGGIKDEDSALNGSSAVGGTTTLGRCASSGYRAHHQIGKERERAKDTHSD